MAQLTKAPPAGERCPGATPTSSRQRWLAVALRALGPALLALAACATCWAAGWRGTDWAAQIYRADQVSRHGLVVWDPGWYAGTLPLGYSLVFPLAGAYLGLWPVAALSAAGSAYCFDRLVDGPACRPAASWYFALLTLVPVAIGQLPTIAGGALALGCVLALSRGWASTGGRRVALASAGLALGALAGLTTPVAGSFLAMALVAWGLSEPAQRLAVGAGAFVLVASAALPLAFPAPGWFPFSFWQAAPVFLIAAVLATPLLGAPAPVRAAGALYAVVTLGLLVLRTPMGDNDARLAAYVGVPLVFCYLPRLVERAAVWRAKARPAAAVLATAAALGLAVWDWSPAAEAFGGATDGASSVASFYAPVAHELRLLTRGHPARVEVPPLAHHWESAYLAPLVPLARGWERQLDLAYAPIFYKPLRASAYRHWLLANGVSYVALANAPLDYAAVAEAALLRSGHAQGLAEVWHNKYWELWKVIGSTGLASPPATVASLGPNTVVVRFSAPGASTVKVRWDRFWSVPSDEASQACVRRAPGGWTLVGFARRGTLRLGVSLLGADHGSCARLSFAAA